MRPRFSPISVSPRYSKPLAESGCAEIDSRKFVVEAMGLEPTNLLTASQALYQLSYAPSGGGQR